MRLPFRHFAQSARESATTRTVSESGGDTNAAVVKPTDKTLPALQSSIFITTPDVRTSNIL